MAEEESVLQDLLQRGKENGVSGLKIVDTKGLKDLEPYAQGVAALHAPTGGIVDSRRFVQVLAEESREHGVAFLFLKRVRGIEESSQGYLIDIGNGNIQAQYVINCAGLYADHFAHRMGGGEAYSIIPFRGEYFAYFPCLVWNKILLTTYHFPLHFANSVYFHLWPGLDYFFGCRSVP